MMKYFLSSVVVLLVASSSVEGYSVSRSSLRQLGSKTLQTKTCSSSSAPRVGASIKMEGMFQILHKDNRD
jgi:hypothetical protein